MSEPTEKAKDSVSRVESIIRSPKAIVGAALFAVSALVSVYVFIDTGNDNLRATIIDQFERVAEGNSTANDDLNYRLGIHRGITIGIAVCGIDGRAQVDNVAKLLQEGT